TDEDDHATALSFAAVHAEGSGGDLRRRSTQSTRTSDRTYRKSHPAAAPWLCLSADRGCWLDQHSLAAQAQTAHPGDGGVRRSTRAARERAPAFAPDPRQPPGDHSGRRTSLHAPLSRPGDSRDPRVSRRDELRRHARCPTHPEGLTRGSRALIVRCAICCTAPRLLMEKSWRFVNS